MVTTISELQPLDFLPGVCPDTDCTPARTPHYIAAQGIRFVKGRPQKIGGWDAITMNEQALSGCVRTVYSAQINDKVQTLLGSNEALFALIGSTLQNVTPAQTTGVAAANSLDTHYDTLGNDPLATTDGSTTIVVTDSDADKYEVNDNYTLSGATAVGGVPIGDINKTHVIRAVGSGTISIRVSTAATSTTTGGGASVDRSSGLITVNSTAHGQPNGDRVSISGATATGGITAVQINSEFIIRNTDTNTFDVMTTGTATSSISGGGGASTEFFEQIADGLCDEQSGQGYGMGLYGVGLYGTALVSTNGRQLPRIWFASDYGDNVIVTPGNGGSIYSWSGSQASAPAIIANAPTEVNYAFTSNNILVTFGAGGVRNKIKTSDQGAITTWTASSTNQVYEDTIEGAGRLKSHVSLNGTNLIFTDTQCYTFRYIGLPLIWDVDFKDNIGIAAPMARVVVKGVAYWMGHNNFYEWRGGNVDVMQSNSSNESTILNYVFDNINRSQISKCFAWYNQKFDEIWFHYPSANSNECDRIARYHVTDKHWTPDTMDRTAAEYPNTNLQLPRLVDSSGNFYRHESGNDNDTSALLFSLTTPLMRLATFNVQDVELVPDSIQTANTDLSVTISGKSYPQSSQNKDSRNFTVSPDTEFLPVGVDARYLQYNIQGEVLGQEWIMGEWLHGVQPSSRSQ